MRTITTNLYQYSELNEQAKQYAIKSLRDRCYEANSRTDWLDANDTITQVEEIANVNVSIQQSSQGYYVEYAWRRNGDYYDKTDQEEFEDFRLDYINQFKENLWCDHMMLKLVKEWEYDERRSYAGNVAQVLVKFCEKIEHGCLSYFDDDAVDDWIECQDFEFTEDGKLYQ